MKTSLPMLALSLALVVLFGGTNVARADGDMADPPTFGLPLPAQGMNDALLDAQRGGSDHTLSTIHADGSVSDVRATDVVTGHNVVTEGALSGASGVPMLIQNTGNGVLIQNAVILNVQVQ